MVWPSWLSAYFLRSRAGYPTKPSETEAERHGYKVAEDVFEHVETGKRVWVDAFEHVKTGIRVWVDALDMRRLDFHGKTALVFHYTDKESFGLITDLTGDSIQLFASRNTNIDSNFGHGTYASSKPPDLWQSTTEVLINNYWPRTADWETWCRNQNPAIDPTLGGKMGTFASAHGYVNTDMAKYANRHSGRAAYCLPILCDALDVIDVQNQETARAYMPPNKNGEYLVRERGKDRWGEDQPPWRDVHVVILWGRVPGADTLGVQNLSLAVSRIRDIRKQRTLGRGRDIIARVRAGRDNRWYVRGDHDCDIEWKRLVFTEVEGPHGWLREDGRLGLDPGHYRVIGGGAGGRTYETSDTFKMALFIGDRCIAEGIPFHLQEGFKQTPCTSALTGAVFDAVDGDNLEIRTHSNHGFLEHAGGSAANISERENIKAFIHLERLE